VARDEEPVRLPLVLGPVSNGEFLPRAAGPADIRLAEAVLSRADVAARRLGVDRRWFLQTTGGMAALLATLNVAACTGGLGRRPPVRRVAGGRLASPSPGGSYRVPPPEDLGACQHALSGRGEFIVDVHTHHVMPRLPWRHTAPDTLRLVLDMVPADCVSSDPLSCVDRASYLHDVFLASDTTVALLSDLPSTGSRDDPLPFADAEGTGQLVAGLARGGASRLLLQNVLAPNFGRLGARLDGMARTVESSGRTGGVSAFKVYTAWGPGGRGYFLDDPRIGLRVVQHAHDLGVRVICGHKGLPLLNFASTWNQPRDMVAVSRQFPDMQFVVYHAGWTPGVVEGPYSRRAPVPPGGLAGIDSLLRALDDYHVPPNSNVWADLATVWRVLLADPNQAAHAVGKLLKRLGARRVLWGTDSVWYGPPQTQIMAFRAFEISDEFQDRYGYPALTPFVKAGVLGLNAAELFGLDPHATRCALATDVLSRNLPVQRALAAAGDLPAPFVARGPVTRGQMLRWLASERGPWIPT